ncbi:MAG TPA: ATP-binding protein [Polyangiaceae bacterium]|jgi:signal transduction histidine kinase|nr:ATP-binding protein [Polyangiaceae bacterium]
MRSSEELKLIAAIADGLPAGVWVATAPEGRFVYSNQAFDEIMGMGPVVNVGVGEFSQPYGICTRDGRPYPEDQLPFVRALRARAAVVVDDIVIHRRDGRRVYVRAFAKPMFDAAERIGHIAIAFFDITREAEANEARQKTQAKLAQTEHLASLGLLAAGVAHEVNNPLSYVLGSLDLIAREIGSGTEALDEKLRAIDERVRDAREGIERIRSIVRDLKVFSRVEEEARSGVVDVRTAIEAALHMAHNEIRHRARITRNLLAVPAVWGQENRVAQLFLNLVINAAQAIPEGDLEKNEVRVATRTTPQGWAEVEVSDTGLGIPADVLPSIFDPFFTTKAIGIGTGLGLSICHTIATDLGGRIEVASESGKGTTFRVLLPPASKQVETKPQSSGREGPRSRKRARLLVIDDEPLILKVITNVLLVEHDVTSELDAGAALDRIRRGERFDAILCDLMMPQVTGMDLYETLLEIAPKQAQTMLFLTGGAFTARAQAFLDRLPNATIEKPFDQATLITRVRQILAR